MKTQTISVRSSHPIHFSRHWMRFSALALLLPMLLPCSSPAAQVASDQAQYPPGNTAIITGSGFAEGETVILQVAHADGMLATGANDGPWEVVTDDMGEFRVSWPVCQEDCVGAALQLTATSQTSGLIAQTTFAVEAPPPLPSTYVLTDQSDYPPGGTAYITGVGFQPGETVVLQVLHADGHASTGEDHAPWSVVADATGAFQTTWHVCEDDCLGATLMLTAVGQTSGLSAYAFFTDACPSVGGEVDLTFDAGSAIDNPIAFAGGPVQSVVVQPNGQVLIGGLFTIVNGAVRSKIARLHADGSTDLAFQNGMAGVGSSIAGFAEVYSLALQPDGKVLVGGLFSTVNGVARISAARVNADGSLDTAFTNTLGGSSPTVYSVALQPDGKVLIGGTFTTVNGVSRNRIARLNSDGTLDTTFQNGMAGANATVRSIAVQSDGKVLLGGDFTSVNGVTRNRIARLNGDGTLDTSFQNGMTGVGPGSVFSVVVQPDGQVLIGGSFSTVNGTTRNRIARLNGADGSLDVTFVAGSVNQVWSIALQTDGKVLIGGTFTSVNSVTRNGIARLNTDGSLDTGFQNGMSGTSGASLGVASIALQPDGQVLLGGQFTAVNGVTRFRLARLNTDGSLDTGFENGPSGPDLPVPSGSPVRDVVLQPDGKLLIGGSFTVVNSVTRRAIARLNTDGSLDTTFQNGMAGATGTGGVGVNSVALQLDGKVLIGGRFSTVNGVARGSIARLNSDGSLDTTFQNGMSGFPLTVSPVLSISVQPDGKVLIGGFFNTVNGVARTNIARLNADGNVDPTFQNGMGGANIRVFSVAVQSDGKVLIGGEFTSVNGVARGGIARLNSDGSLDTTFQNGMSGVVPARVFSVDLQPDGQVLIGGWFGSVNGVARGGIARLNGTDGSLDTTFQNGMSGVSPAQVNAVKVQPDGKVLVGGLYGLFNGVARSSIARLNTDGSLDTTFQNGLSGVRRVASGTSGTVESLALQPDGKVLIGGEFEIVNGVVRERVARLIGSGADTTPPTITCPANQVAPTDPGQCSAVVNYPAPAASDECSTATVSCTPPAGSSFPKGTTTVNCTATDASGNTATCSFTVTVNDTEPPTIACPANIVISTDPGLCEAVVTFTASAADNCPGVTLVCDPPSGSAFPTGTTSVNCLASDAADNTATCSFTVTVTDMEDPTISCPADITVSSGSLCGSSSGVVTFPTPSAADNCGVASVACVPASGSTFPAGATTVTCTATDTSGNTAQCSFTVTVQSQSGSCESILANPDRSRVHFNSQGQSEFAFFRGSLELTGGNLAPDFRVVPGNTARGALKVTIGNTVAYCNENIIFTVHDCSDPTNNREKWKYNAGPLEKMFLRWKDDQEYIAARDPNVPVSAATGNRNIGLLETRFIHDDETRFRYNFKDAARPVTITVDGMVLLTVRADGTVTSPFPHWKYGKVVEVLYPDRLVPGNDIAWYADGDLSNNGGLPENFVYQHEASANGNATDTYFNAGGRFFIKVPVSGVSLTSLPRSAQVQFTLGEQSVTLVGCGDFVVPSYTVVGHNWKFNDGPDDCESED